MVASVLLGQAQVGVPVAIEALAALSLIAILLVAIALTTGVKVFVSALFLLPNATLGWVPWLGGKVRASSLKIEQKINGELAGVISKMEGAVSKTWHFQAWLIEQTGQAIWDATKMGAHALWLAEIRYPLKGLDAAIHGIRPKVTHVTKVAGATVKNVTVYKGISAAQWKATLRRIGVLSARVAALPALGAGALVLPFPRIGALERRVRTWGSRLTRLEARFGKKAFAAAVAFALSTLGLAWIRRSCVKRNAERLCKVDPGILDDLLGGLIGIGFSLSVVTFANAVLDAADEVVPLLQSSVKELKALGPVDGSAN